MNEKRADAYLLIKVQLLFNLIGSHNYNTKNKAGCCKQQLSNLYLHCMLSYYLYQLFSFQPNITVCKLFYILLYYLRNKYKSTHRSGCFLEIKTLSMYQQPNTHKSNIIFTIKEYHATVYLSTKSLTIASLIIGLTFGSTILPSFCPLTLHKRLILTTLIASNFA